MAIIKLPNAKCLRCGHSWTPRKNDVRICPQCKSVYWDTDKPSQDISENKKEENAVV